MNPYDRRTQLLRAQAVLLHDQARLLSLQAEARDDLKEEEAVRLSELPVGEPSRN